jgi:hypothetical protein
MRRFGGFGVARGWLRHGGLARVVVADGGAEGSRLVWGNEAARERDRPAPCGRRASTARRSSGRPASARSSTGSPGPSARWGGALRRLLRHGEGRGHLRGAALVPARPPGRRLQLAGLVQRRSGWPGAVAPSTAQRSTRLRSSRTWPGKSERISSRWPSRGRCPTWIGEGGPAATRSSTVCPCSGTIPPNLPSSLPAPWRVRLARTSAREHGGDP